jgi:hypothetical protein
MGLWSFMASSLENHTSLRVRAPKADLVLTPLWVSRALKKIAIFYRGWYWRQKISAEESTP